MVRIERSNEKYNRALVKEIQRADRMPPEKRVFNAKELLDWLDEQDGPVTPQQIAALLE